MRNSFILILFLLFENSSFFAQSESYTSVQSEQNEKLGHTNAKYIEVKETNSSIYIIDHIEDSINYINITGDIFRDTSNRLYIKCLIPDWSKVQIVIDTINNDSGLDLKDSINITSVTKDSTFFVEILKDYTSFFDLKTYKKINDQYFINKSKVYLWWGNSDGDYPIEIVGADAKTFIPFIEVAGGTDKNFVYFGCPSEGFNIVKGANPKKIKILSPSNGCWNCCSCYFIDNKNVFFNFDILLGADIKTFKIINEDNIDAEDKNGRYFKGKLIN